MRRCVEPFGLTHLGLPVAHWQSLNRQWFGWGPNANGHGALQARPPLIPRAHREQRLQWLQQLALQRAGNGIIHRYLNQKIDQFQFLESPTYGLVRWGEYPKGKELIVFSNFVAWNFTVNYFCKNATHDVTVAVKSIPDTPVSFTDKKSPGFALGA